MVGTQCDCEHINVNHSGQLDTRVVEVQCDNSVNIRTISLSETTNDLQNLHPVNSIDSNFNGNDEKWFTESGLKVASLNVNRLIGKLDQIKMCLDNHTPDVFGLCETFLNNNVDNQLVQHKNYVTERKDRLSGKSGGGILCYVRENIQYKRRLDLETDLELIWLEIFFFWFKKSPRLFFLQTTRFKILMA